MQNQRKEQSQTASVETWKDLFLRKRQFFLYCCLGMVGVIVDLLTFWVLAYFGSVHPQIANLVSTFCGIVTSFLLNSTFTFQSKNRLLLRALSFIAVGIAGLGLSALTLYILIDLMNVGKIFAKVACLYVVFVQYNLNRLVSFRR